MKNTRVIMGAIRITRVLQNQGIKMNRKRVGKLLHKMSL